MMIETQNNSTTMIGVRVNSGKKFRAHARLCIFFKVELCFVAITRAQLNTSGIIHAPGAFSSWKVVVLAFNAHFTWAAFRVVKKPKAMRT